MPAFRQSFLTRLAQSSMNVALRFWPAESRHWGEALAAELSGVSGPFEALFWALGGIMLFARALGSRFATWLKLPVGGSFRSAMLNTGDKPSFLPTRSRLVTAVLLICTAALLLFPSNREALRTVRASWRSFQESGGDLRTLDALAARAEKERDARTLAFVAISYSDPQRGMRYAERAVELDPTLYWIYASNFYHPTQRPRPAEWIKRLQASDPENAFCYVLAAQDAVEPRLEALRRNGVPAIQDYDAAVKADAEWLRLMHRAVHSPRYDSYFEQHWELSHEVWSRESSLPFWVIAHGLHAFPIPQLVQIHTFTDILIHRAQQARAASHADQAAQILQDVTAFGSRMAYGRSTDLERLVGIDVSRQALRELHALYTGAGRSEEVQAVALHLQKIDSLRKDMLQRSSHSVSDPGYVKLFRQAVVVQFSVVFMILCGLLTVISLLALELRAFLPGTKRTLSGRLMCLMVDYFPSALLALSLIFLLTFRPFAQHFEQFRAGDPWIWYSRS